VRRGLGTLSYIVATNQGTLSTRAGLMGALRGRYLFDVQACGPFHSNVVGCIPQSISASIHSCTALHPICEAVLVANLQPTMSQECFAPPSPAASDVLNHPSLRRVRLSFRPTCTSTSGSRLASSARPAAPTSTMSPRRPRRWPSPRRKLASRCE